MLRLQLMRHGKSDWDASYGVDHERPLTSRGERSARTMGAVVRSASEVPDVVVSSTAVRARTTAELARIGGGWACPLELDDDLYGAGTSEVLRIAAQHGDSQPRLMLVGHEPTFSSLVTRLTGANAPVKTATIAAIDLPITGWNEAPSAQGTLAYLLHPRLFSEVS